MAENSGGCRADCPSGFHYHMSCGVTAQGSIAAYERGDWTVSAPPTHVRRMSRLWPKGYEQSEAARLISTNPDVYRSAPLRRIPWWRRWRKRG